MSRNLPHGIILCENDKLCLSIYLKCALFRKNAKNMSPELVCLFQENGSQYTIGFDLCMVLGVNCQYLENLIYLRVQGLTNSLTPIMPHLLIQRKDQSQFNMMNKY